MTTSFYSECSDPKLVTQFEYEGQPHHIMTSLQKCSLINTNAFGECLFINGMMQSSQKDEYIYHEMFVHTLMSCLKEPKRICIIGGAEGCLAREVLKWTSVKEVLQIDWDDQLVDYFKKDAKGVDWNGGIYEEPRLKVIHENVYEWIQNEKEQQQFDAIFVDLFDPTTMEESLQLSELCRELKARLLAPGGGIAVNAGVTWGSEEGQILAKRLKEVFSNFGRFAAHVFVPSFLAEWTMLFCVPVDWRRIIEINIPRIPSGLRRFTFQAMNHAITWSKDAPQEFCSFLYNDSHHISDNYDNYQGYSFFN